MSGFNSILGYAPTDSTVALQDSIGITQFPTETSWHQTIGGLQIQGGLTDSVPGNVNFVVPFSAPYETQLLGVFTQPIDQHSDVAAIISAGTNKTQFTLYHLGTARRYYWLAIGV